MSKNFISRLLLCSVLAQGMILNASTANDDKRYFVKNITLQGNSHISSDSIIYYLGIKTGNEYSQNEIDLMIKNAFDKGFFKKISISHFQNTLIVSVEEQPIISSIQFFGNKKINDKEIEKIIKTKTGVTLSETILKKDIETILAAYQQKGFFGAAVNSKIIENDNGGIKINFEIREGRKSGIKKIAFVGNGEFSDSELKQNILSGESAFYKFFSNNSTYDVNRLQIDAELLSEYYQARGYPFAKVTNTSGELDAKGEAFIVTFAIDSGEKYAFGNVTLHDEINISNKQEIVQEIQKIPAGKAFDINAIRNAEEQIKNILSKKGYAFANIEHVLQKANKKVNVEIKIHSTHKFFVNHINILNNTRTRDDVIRREMRISEHDSYDLSKIERSMQRIKSLGYFHEVEFTPKRIENSDKVDLDIAVNEKRTGTALFNVGYNTVMGAFFGVRYDEINLLGTGRNLTSNLQFAKLEKAFDFGINEPYFMGLDAISGVNIFYNKRENNNHFIKEKHKYNVSSRGIGAHITYNLTEYLKHDLNYGVKFENLDYGDNEVMSELLRPETKTHTVSSIGHTLIYDKTDNGMSPTNGYVLRFGQSFAGLGGDSKYIQNVVSASFYRPIYKDKVIAKLSSQGGMIHGISKKVRILDNFYSEDYMIRGFGYNGIGPRDSKTLDEIGGKTYFAASAEIKFPLGLPKEIGINGIAFADCATLYDIDEPKNIENVKGKYFNSKKLRASYGAGIIWESPIGLIRLEYGIPIAKAKFDHVEKFNFSIGRSF